MSKLLQAAVTLLYLGTGIIAGVIIMLVSASVDLGMTVGGIIVLVAAGLYARALWTWKRGGSMKPREVVIDTVRTALGVNHRALQTADAQEFVRVRDEIAEVVADQIAAQEALC